MMFSLIPLVESTVLYKTTIWYWRCNLRHWKNKFCKWQDNWICHMC